MNLRQDLTRRRHLWMMGEWEIPDNIDTTGFDFSWRPDYYDRPYIHEFGTQWQKTGGPRFVIPEAEGIKYQSHQQVRRLPDMTNWEVPASISAEQFDFSWHPDATEPPLNYEFATQWQPTGGPIYRTAGAQNIKLVADQTAVRLPNLRRWIIHEEIDMGSFDFSWHPDHRDPPYNYVFGNHLYPPNEMPTLTYRVSGAETEKYSTEQFARLRSVETVTYKDSIASQLKQHQFEKRFAVFAPENISIAAEDYITDGATLHIIDDAIAIVPEQAQTHIGDGLYDYPKITRHRLGLYVPDPLDVVFLSNGESGAEENYEHLLKVLAGKPNRLTRVSNVKGRINAYQAAAEASTTEWFFLVFAKLQVNSEFDWSWQPDRTQVRKHYIFNAFNPVTQLNYGHMAMVAYNKTITMTTPGLELDFVMEGAHRVIPLDSGVAYFNSDAWTTWRTAFREVIKLKRSTDSVSQERLRAWLTLGTAQYAQDCLAGALAAVEYYDKVGGDYAQLRLSYEWDWLEDFYRDKYKIQE